MTLNEALRNYSRILATMALMPSSDKLKKDLDDFFEEWKKEILLLIRELRYEDEYDPRTATIFFSALSNRMKGKNSGAFLATYYCATKCQLLPLDPQDKKSALRWRAICLAYNENSNYFISFAHGAPMFEYKGNLSFDEFYDFLIMSDIFKIWDFDPDSQRLMSLQRQVLKRKTEDYQSYTKQYIITEGEKAHEALFNCVKQCLRL